MILDGGLATELEARGCDISGSLWSARVLRTAPETIEQLHYDFYAAGADCAITASYQASYEGFAGIGLDDGETTRLLRLSVELARSARARYLREHPEDDRELFPRARCGNGQTHGRLSKLRRMLGSWPSILARHARPQYRRARARLGPRRRTVRRRLLPGRAGRDREVKGGPATACHPACHPACNCVGPARDPAVA